MFEIIDVNRIPSLDLHGESSDIARVLIESFIKENVKLKREFIAIVHGKGTGILRSTTREVLTHNKNVEEFKLYWFNDGMTVVRLKNKEVK